MAGMDKENGHRLPSYRKEDYQERIISKAAVSGPLSTH